LFTFGSALQTVLSFTRQDEPYAHVLPSFVTSHKNITHYYVSIFFPFLSTQSELLEQDSLYPPGKWEVSPYVKGYDTILSPQFVFAICATLVF